MTAITFPTDPANGELYTAPNGAVYIWDGEKWMVNSTTYTGTALTEITQDRVHSMFTHGENVGISFSYNDSTDKLIATGLSISDFGEGFTDSLDAGKITTSKLYNENPNPGLNNQYTLEVTNGGVVVLPDGSIINGATLKTIAGNYAGITAGPASPAGKDEDSWVWVDNNGATIATKYSTDNHQWKFGNDGTLTLPDSATVAVGDIGVLQGLQLAYDNSREQLNMAFAAYSYEGDGWPAGSNSYNALLLSTDPAIRPEWIPLAQSVRTAWLALGSALEPIYLDIQVAGYTWNFSNAGDFSVPGNKAIKGFDNLQLNVDGGGGKTAVVEIDGYNSKVLIKTTTPGAGIIDDAWTFGDAGELTLPVGGVIQTLTTPQVGTGLTDIPGWYRADINAKTAGFWMDITPQSLKDAMDDTGLVGWQFNPDGTTDYYTVLAAEYVEGNTILELTFDANLPLESAPYSVTSPNFSARTSSGISIIANENEWTFDTNGNLQLPVGGDIVDSTGASVLGGGAGDSIDNGAYSVTVADTGVVTMSTSRGTVEFGALPEPGGPQHFHIMKGAGQDGSGGVDLYFGDDYNYVLQRADSYQGSPAYGVEIGANDRDGGDQHVWRFDPDGDLHIPPGKTIRDAMTGDDLLDGGISGGTVIASKVWVQDFATSLGLNDVPVLASSVEYLANGDVVALFSHLVDNESSSYSGVARFDSTGTRVWSMNFTGSLYTNGWGLAVDNAGGYIYVAGAASADGGYEVATLTKLSQVDGSEVWSKQYDVGYANNNLVVDVAADGSPVVVGYADNGTDKQVVTTKIDSADGSVTWSKALNGQGDEEAYGMAMGPSGEVVSVGWMDQHDEQITRSVTPLYGSDTGILVINRSDLNGATFTDSWEVAGTGITGTANINSINTYDALTGTVQQGSGAEFTIEVNGAVINTESMMGSLTVATETFGGNTAHGYSSLTSPTFGSWIPYPNGAAASVAELYYVAEAPTPYTRLKLIPGIYDGFTVAANGLIANNPQSIAFVVVEGGALMTPEEVSPGDYVYFNRTGDVYNLASYNTLTPSVKVGYSDIPDTPGTYSVLVTNGGTNYIAGHKVKVLGTALGGTTPENDVVIEVDAVVSGAITSVSRTGDANVAAVGPYTAVAHTNHLTGSGLTFDFYGDSASTYTEHLFYITAGGTDYVQGDTVVIPGTQLGGTSPANDLTVTVTALTDTGEVIGFNTFSGAQQTTTYRIIVTGSTVNFSGPGAWTLGNLTNDTVNRMLVVKYALSDGAIDWQASVQVDAGLDCKGADADIDGGGNIYVCGNFEEDGGANFTKMIIFKLDTAGVKQWSRKVEGTCEDFATSIVVGPDGYLYLSAVTNTGSDFSMVIAKYDTNGNVIWQRLLDNTTSWTFGGATFFGNGGGSNLAVRNGYVAVSGSFGDPNTVIPYALVAQFDTDGSEITLGDYDFVAASFSGVLDNTASEITVAGAAKTDLDRSESFIVTDFNPTVDLTSDLIGTKYSSPSGAVSSVKLTAPNSRKIEEAFGYNSVSVTERNFGSVVTTTAAFANSGNQNSVTVNVTATQLEELVALINSNTFYYFEVSLDNDTYRKATYAGYNNTLGSENFTFVLSDGVTLFVNGGFTVYYRIVTGADPMVWWNSADLPNGNNNFRGAVIDYHAYTGESTIIGTIHIVNDDGEEHISHTEVQSGTSDGENDYLWLVQNEGTVSYYRIDGESKTLKVQWTAKVFYGSEYYDD